MSYFPTTQNHVARLKATQGTDRAHPFPGPQGGLRCSGSGRNISCFAPAMGKALSNSAEGHASGLYLLWGRSSLTVLCTVSRPYIIFFPSDVLFHKKALSEQILRVCYPLVSGHPPFQPSLHRFGSSEYGCTSGNPGYSPRAVSAALSGRDQTRFCITFYSRWIEIYHCIPETLLMC